MKLQGIMGFPQANSTAQFAGVLTLHLPSAFQVTQEPSVTKCCFITKEAVFLCEMRKARYSCGGLCQSLVSFFFSLPPWTWSLLLNLEPFTRLQGSPPASVSPELGPQTCSAAQLASGCCVLFNLPIWCFLCHPRMPLN